MWPVQNRLSKSLIIVFTLPNFMYRGYIPFVIHYSISMLATVNQSGC